VTVANAPSLSATTARGRVPRRILQLLLGLALLGLATWLLVRARLGLTPWVVLHQGLALQLGVSLGAATIGVGLLLLLAWIPLRERPGIGTVANVLLVGLAVDATLAVVPAVESLAIRIAFAVVGVVLMPLSIAVYIGVRLGPGPRDGLMTALVRRTGRSIRLVRTCIEVVVALAGFLLGGTVGLVTIILVLVIGPLTQFFVKYVVVHLPGDADQPAAVLTVADRSGA
jgi:uncharacterized membrane protein YczE